MEKLLKLLKLWIWISKVKFKINIWKRHYRGYLVFFIKRPILDFSENLNFAAQALISTCSRLFCWTVYFLDNNRSSYFFNNKQNKFSNSVSNDSVSSDELAKILAYMPLEKLGSWEIVDFQTSRMPKYHMFPMMLMTSCWRLWVFGWHVGVKKFWVTPLGS